MHWMGFIVQVILQYYLISSSQYQQKLCCLVLNSSDNYLIVYTSKIYTMHVKIIKILVLCA